MKEELKLKLVPNDFSLLSPLGEENEKDYIADYNGAYLHAHFLEEGEELDDLTLLKVLQIDAPSLDSPLYLARDEDKNKNGLLFPLHLGGSLACPQEDLPEFKAFVEAIYLSIRELWSSRVYMEIRPEDIYFEGGKTFLGYPFRTRKDGDIRDLAILFAYFGFVSLGMEVDYEDVEDRMSLEDPSFLDQLEEKAFILYLYSEGATLEDIRRYLNGTLDLKSSSAHGFLFLEESYMDAPSLMEAFQEHFLNAIEVVEGYEDNGLLPFLLDSEPLKAEMAEFYLIHSSRDPSLALFQLIHLYLPKAHFVFGKNDFVSITHIAKEIQTNSLYAINPKLLGRDFIFASLQGNDNETLVARNKIERLFESYPSLPYDANKAAIANTFKKKGYLYFKGHEYTVKEFAKASLRLLQNDLGASDLLSDPQAFLSLFLLSDGSIEQEIVMPLLGERDARRFLCKLSVILNNALPFFHEGDDIETPMDFIRLSNEAYESGGEEDKAFFRDFFASPDLDLMCDLFPSSEVLREARREADPVEALYFLSAPSPKYRGRFASVDEVVRFVLSSDDPEYESGKIVDDPAFSSFLAYFSRHKK
ncbi:MAG: hypothetical protein K6B65_02195 [Bacilli bacterium]|nr:hypothetical protein [Bacilli bacterium]